MSLRRALSPTRPAPERPASGRVHLPIETAGRGDHPPARATPPARRDDADRARTCAMSDNRANDTAAITAVLENLYKAWDAADAFVADYTSRRVLRGAGGSTARPPSCVGWRSACSVRGPGRRCPGSPATPGPPTSRPSPRTASGFSTARPGRTTGTAPAGLPWTCPPPSPHSTASPPTTCGRSAAAGRGHAVRDGECGEVLSTRKYLTVDGSRERIADREPPRGYGIKGKAWFRLNAITGVPGTDKILGVGSVASASSDPRTRSSSSA